MEKVIYTNSLGDSIVFASNSALNRLKSISMTPLTETAQTSKGYQQDGYDYESAYAEMRDIALSVIVMGTAMPICFSGGGNKQS